MAQLIKRTNFIPVIQRFQKGGATGNRFDNFVAMLYQPYLRAVKKYGVNPAYIPYLMKLAANESTYGANPRGGKNGNNYGGVIWNSSHGRGYSVHTDGKKYTSYKNVDDFADHHVQFINNVYDNVLKRPNLDLYTFMDVLHGNNSGNRHYSAGTAQSYFNVVNNMKSLDKAIAKYLNVK